MIPQSQKYITRGTKVPVDIARKIDELAGKSKKSVSRFMRELIEEKMKSDVRVVTKDVFKYDKRSGKIIWYGLLENGKKWRIMPVNIETASDWVTQLQGCIKIASNEHECCARRRIRRG